MTSDAAAGAMAALPGRAALVAACGAWPLYVALSNGSSFGPREQRLTGFALA